MSRTMVERVADAVLYEGYILYPYRPSVKNRQRWTFGGLYPEAYCREQRGADASANQTECLVEGGPETTVEAIVRFLHLTSRVVGELTPPLAEWSEGAEPSFRPVESLRLGDRLFQTWQEAEECAVALGNVRLGELEAAGQRRGFTIRGKRWLEPLPGVAGDLVGVLLREQQALDGLVTLEARPAAEGLYRLMLRVENRTPLEDAGRRSCDEALMRSLVSTHAILGVRGGAFVSLLDPPEAWSELAAGCRNVGTWPVLVGEEGERHTVLSSPIILYDYPRVAPESPGDLFDSAEIDEILTLRILTLTDEEKRQMVGVDERARALLARTEGLAGDDLLRLHGTVRTLRPPSEEGAHG